MINRQRFGVRFRGVEGLTTKEVRLGDYKIGS